MNAGPGIRLLYVPNEDGDFRQIGFRRPIENLKSAGLIEDRSVYSLQQRQRASGRERDEIAGLVERVRQFRPTVILMQHLGSTHLTPSDFSKIRAICDFELIYHEADPYSRFLHPLPRAAAAAGRASDVTFTVGTGTFAENFRRAGAREVRWVPHVFEPDRYPPSDGRLDHDREFDFVMIANRNRPRFRGLPNWRDRIRFVELMQTTFGKSFAIFGRGWEGPSAQGPVDFSRQSEAARRGWMTVNWDHYANEPYYFSNRLPISLAAGTIHATTLHPGYDVLFPKTDFPFLIFEPSVESLVTAVGSFREDASVSEKVRLTDLARRYAHDNCRQDDQLVAMLNWREVRVDPIAARRAWDLSAEYPDQL